RDQVVDVTGNRRQLIDLLLRDDIRKFLRLCVDFDATFTGDDVDDFAPGLRRQIKVERELRADRHLRTLRVSGKARTGDRHVILAGLQVGDRGEAFVVG